jgi:endonuclease/exonuclease/phosphatase family metal-dependent hydrolase
MKNPKSQYISVQTVKNSIDSRMAAMAYFDMPGVGLLRFVSVHVSWGDVQSAQLAALNEWAKYSSEAPGIFLICGDFNMNFDTPGYKQMTEEYLYTDAYRTANPGGKADGTTSGSRIDYQFLIGKNIVPVLAQRLFTGAPNWDAAFKQVSDHYGVLVWYQVTSEK